MGFFSNLFKPKPSIPVTMPQLPEIIETALVTNNNYLGKYSNNGIANEIYLLYSDFSSSYRWIKDSTKPDKYFDNYIKSLQILSVLNNFSKKHKFDNPTPSQQIYELRVNYIENTNRFIDRFWLATIESVKKLKTEKGRQNKINTFFTTLTIDFSAYLSDSNITYISSLKNQSIFDSVETIKQEVKCGKYDVSTIENIQAIPHNDYEVMRSLQKSATDHKRNGDLQLAIECLKKSNTISDSIPGRTGKLMEKEYLRVIKYIELTGNHELAKAEEQKILKIHPEFWDKRISNKKYIDETINRCISWDNDLIEIFTQNSCPVCGKYNMKVYSISGKSLKYPKLPDEVKLQTHSCKDCIMTANSFFEGIHRKP